MSNSVELRGTGQSWAGYRGDQRVTPFRTRPEQATDLIEKLNRAARKRERPCMCCGTAFDSEGPHNRMCGTCRTKTGGMI